MKRMIYSGVLSLLLALAVSLTPALAQASNESAETITETDSLSDMEGCLYQSQMQGHPPEGCIGIISSPCLDEAFSTQDMVMCSVAETEFWDARLNRVYKELREAYKAEDVEDTVKLAPLLRTTQLKWIEWRDTKCLEFERNRYRGGTMGRLSAASCVMHLTAERVFELEDLLAETRM